MGRNAPKVILGGVGRPSCRRTRLRLPSWGAENAREASITASTACSRVRGQPGSEVSARSQGQTLRSPVGRAGRDQTAEGRDGDGDGARRDGTRQDGAGRDGAGTGQGSGS